MTSLNLRGLMGRGSVAAAIVAALCAVPASAATTTQESRFTLTPSKTDKATLTKPVPSILGINLRIANDDGTQPPATTVVDFYVPKGIKIAPEAFAVCPLSKLETNQQASCDPKSIVGGGTGEVDARASGIFDKPLQTDVTNYNSGKDPKTGRPSITVFARARGLQVTVPLPVDVQNGGKKWAYILHLPVPRVPTVPGLPDASFVAATLKYDKRGTGKKRFFNAVAPCPRKGWAFLTVTKFNNGTTIKTPNTVKC